MTGFLNEFSMNVEIFWETLVERVKIDKNSRFG